MEPDKLSSYIQPHANPVWYGKEKYSLEIERWTDPEGYRNNILTAGRKIKTNQLMYVREEKAVSVAHMTLQVHAAK